MDPRLMAWRDELTGPPEYGTCEGCYEEATVYAVRHWRAVGDREPRNYTVRLCRWCLGMPAEDDRTQRPR